MKRLLQLCPMPDRRLVAIRLQRVVSEFAKAFIHNFDGSWTCVAPATLDNGVVRRLQVVPGTTVLRGQRFMNVDLADLLDRVALQGK
jgi:hypothetical protein